MEVLVVVAVVVLRVAVFGTDIVLSIKKIAPPIFVGIVSVVAALVSATTTSGDGNYVADSLIRDEGYVMSCRTVADLRDHDIS